MRPVESVFYGSPVIENKECPSSAAIGCGMNKEGTHCDTNEQHPSHNIKHEQVTSCPAKRWMIESRRHLLSSECPSQEKVCNIPKRSESIHQSVMDGNASAIKRHLSECPSWEIHKYAQHALEAGKYEAPTLCTIMMTMQKKVKH